MKVTRRQLLASLSASAALGVIGCDTSAESNNTSAQVSLPLKLANGDIDWNAVRELFPLRRDWTHLATFLFVSHPQPVARAIAEFRDKIDSDTVWIELAAFSEAEGRPFASIKKSLAEYTGGKEDEFCLTSNTTTALSMFWHGLRIRPDQTILTSEDDHYSQHESIRYATWRTGSSFRFISLYDNAASANADEIISRVEKAITPKTRAIGLTWVHSSTGVKIPVARIAEVVANANRGRASADRCLLVIDGVHGFGNQNVNVAQLGCDFFATGTHKWLFAPRGTGFLWGKSDAWQELRPTIPTFDPDGAEATWTAWGTRQDLPPTKAAFVSPGGFLAYENFLAIPAAIALHKSIGRDKIANRIAALNGRFREEVAKVPGVTLHTPRDPELSGGISCYEIAGLKPDEIANKLAEKKIRTNSSPYRVPLARVAAGIMNSEEEVDQVLREIASLARK